ncbi:MAG: UvrD-helicase domain-containing protein [Methanomicrobiaceae archaeon]|nr:UvrD-helicase domain-containing protein [Methanomicrobiaceae archaeon]
MLTERQREALRHDISLCVTAGAGTGKTHVLVNRYISLIENAGCRPSGILALTFTDKAASEMKERVEAEIFKKEGPFWEQIKEEMMWANISTFHSFCSKVLREFPIESGIDPGFAILSDNESEEIIAGAISSLFNTTPDNNIKESLSECLCAYGTYHLELFLRELYRQRRYSEEFFLRLRTDEAGILQNWKEALSEEKKRIASEFKRSENLLKAADSLFALAENFSGDNDKGAKYLKSVYESLRLLKSDNTDDICKGLFGIATTSGGAKNMGSKKVFGESKELLTSSYSVLKDYADSLPSDILALEIGEDKPETERTLKILKCLGEIYLKMAGDLRREKHIRGAIDFTDMINLTYELFRNNPAVKESFRGRYRFIMIDEFQDTDPVQAEITAAILEEEGESGIWGLNRLFIVGDPKQSIYLFRDADVTQFKRTGESIKEDYKGLTVSLDINFRSTKEILSFVNRFFSELLTESDKPWDFGYEPISVSDKRAKDSGSVELIICPNADTARERAVFEAETISKKIRMIMDSDEIHVYSKNAPDKKPRMRNASWSDIAVLIERRTNLKYIEYAMKKYGIPYRVHAGLGLYEKQEIFDALSVLSFLKNPDDDISLYAALRSPWFGFSDAELFRICKGYATGLFGRLKRTDDKKAKKASEMLSAWLKCARKKAPSEIFRQIVRESGIIAVYSGIPGGIQILANLEKLSDIIREREKTGFYTLDRLVSDINTSVSSNEKAGEAEPDDTGEDSVTVMTVHASKGLEFPIVIVPGLSDSPPSDNSSIIIDGDLGAGIKIPDFETGDDFINSPPLSVQRYRQKQKMQAESKRLFYVAATRARDHLIMSGTEPKEIPGSYEACKTRMDYLMYSLFSLSEDGIKEGVHDAGCKNTPCNIRITRSESMPQYPGADKKGRFIHLPEGIPESGNLGDSQNATKSSQKVTKTFSATEIETYLKSPEKHRKNFVEKRTDIPLREGILQDVDRGKIVHEIFAGKDSASVLKKYRQDEEQNLGDFNGIFRKFMDSSFMKDARDSYCELAFTTTIGGYRFSGSIDRLVLKSDGWYIIDYKTGEKKDEDSYLIQMAVYKKAAEDILGSSVRTFIYHTQTEEFTEISPDEKEILSLIIRTCKSISGEYI